jgi:hypothetical protein
MIWIPKPSMSSSRNWNRSFNQRPADNYLLKNIKKIAVIRIGGFSQIPIAEMTVKYWGRKYHILFIILISFWGLTVPTYTLFYSLEEMDVFHPPHWEDPVEESLLANFEKTWTASGWIFCAIISPQENEFLILFSVLALAPIPIEKTPTLRC